LIKTFLRHPARIEFLGNVAKLTGGTTLAQVIAILASPVLTRLYSPADFGVFAVFTSIVAVLTVIASARYEMGIVIAKNQSGAVRLISLAGIILLLLTGVVLLFSVVWPGLIIHFSGFAGEPYLIYLLPLSFLAAGMHQVLLYWTNRKKKFGLNAFAKVAQSIVQVVVALWYGLLSVTAAGLILGHVLGVVAGAGILLVKNVSLLSDAVKVTARQMVYTAGRFRDFPYYTLPTSVLDILSLSLPVFLISSWYNESLTGQYALALRMLSLPLNLIGISVGQVFFQKLSETFRRKGNTRKLITSAWMGLALLGILPMLLILFAGPLIFQVVFGQEWDEAGRIASILSIPLFLAFCSSPTSSAFVVFGMQRISLIFGVLAIFLRPLAFYMGFLQTNLHLSLALWAVVDVILIIGFNILIYLKSRPNPDSL
jgi:lipopolysaccharide exporter